MAPAARVTALIASDENMKTTEAPMIRPTRFFGSETFSTPVYSRLRTLSSSSAPVSITAVLTESVNEPNSAVAARTAVEMAMPLVMAFVVLPTASRSVSTREPASSMSPDISAMPCALSEIGPKVSIATMTPTVVSRPVPASATQNRPRITDPPPRR